MPRLGSKETAVIARLSYEKATVITRERLKTLFRDTTYVRQIIYRLMKKGILQPITRGIYYYSPLESGLAGSRINEFLIPPILFPRGNYYVGYSNMFNYYGFTDQLFQTLYVLNTSLQRNRIICGRPFKLLKIPSSRMYGLETIQINKTEVVVSDRERTLVDLVNYPDPVGGLKRAFEIVKEQVTSQKIDLQKFVRYTLSFPVKSVQKRIGYVLEECRIPPKNLALLKRKVQDTSLITLYGSKSRKGKILSSWKVILDDAS
jgi:predicted transcriptional regulator of viral defense system